MTKELFKVFEENFTAICKFNKVSIRKVFKECGIPRSRYYYWNGEENGLDTEDVLKISKYLQTSPRYLLTDHSLDPLNKKETHDVLSEVAKAFGNDARRLLVNYLQLNEAGKRGVLSNAILRANSLYGVSGDKRYEDTATSN